MAKAKVTLNDQGPLTYTGNGYTLSRGQSFTTVKDEDILFFSNRPGFTVDLLEGRMPGSAAAVEEDEAPKAKPTAKAKKKSAPPPPEEDDEEEKEDDEAEEEEDDEVTGELDADELGKQTKASLAQLAEERGLKFDANATKAQLIALLTK